MPSARILLICSLMSLFFATHGSAGEPRVFDREITAQRFDKEPFRQIAIPEWVEVCYCQEICG